MMNDPATTSRSTGDAVQCELPGFPLPKEEGIEADGQGVEVENLEGDSGRIDKPFDPTLIQDRYEATTGRPDHEKNQPRGNRSQS